MRKGEGKDGGEGGGGAVFIKVFWATTKYVTHSTTGVRNKGYPKTSTCEKEGFIS